MGTDAGEPIHRKGGTDENIKRDIITIIYIIYSRLYTRVATTNRIKLSNGYRIISSYYIVISLEPNGLGRSRFAACSSGILNFLVFRRVYLMRQRRKLNYSFLLTYISFFFFSNKNNCFSVRSEVQFSFHRLNWTARASARTTTGNKSPRLYNILYALPQEKHGTNTRPTILINMILKQKCN